MVTCYDESSYKKTTYWNYQHMCRQLVGPWLRQDATLTGQRTSVHDRQPAMAGPLPEHIITIVIIIFTCFQSKDHVCVSTTLR
jgi:hypothetical protein